jgi:hypothetical protein
MLKTFASLSLALAALAAPAKAFGGVGEAPPEFKATKWYNTAPISLEDLKGKTVHLVVFRTW